MKIEYFPHQSSPRRTKPRNAPIIVRLYDQIPESRQNTDQPCTLPAPFSPNNNNRPKARGAVASRPYTAPPGNNTTKGSLSTHPRWEGQGLARLGSTIYSARSAKSRNWARGARSARIIGGLARARPMPRVVITRWDPIVASRGLRGRAHRHGFAQYLLTAARASSPGDFLNFVNSPGLRGRGRRRGAARRTWLRGASLLCLLSWACGRFWRRFVVMSCFLSWFPESAEAWLFIRGVYGIFVSSFRFGAFGHFVVESSYEFAACVKIFRDHICVTLVRACNVTCVVDKKNYTWLHFSCFRDNRVWMFTILCGYTQNGLSALEYSWKEQNCAALIRFIKTIWVHEIGRKLNLKKMSTTDISFWFEPSFCIQEYIWRSSGMKLWSH